VVQESAKCSAWQHNDLIFPSGIGSPFAKTDLERGYHVTLAQANLRRARVHDLRLTAASLMLNHGIPPLVVSKILGHANPTVTLLIYAHSNLEMQTEAAALMDSIITPIPADISDLQPGSSQDRSESPKLTQTNEGYAERGAFEGAEQELACTLPQAQVNPEATD
jgi:hypothetical protein